MAEYISVWDWAEAFVEGRLGAVEKQQLDARCSSDPGFDTQFREAVDLLRSLHASGRNRRFREMLQEVHAQSEKVQPVRRIRLSWNHLRVAGMAAGVALLTSLLTVWAMQGDPGANTSSYNTLANIQQDLNRIKSTQHQQNLTISKIRDTLVRMGPEADMNSSGTAFALTGNGYMVTNYHVVNGADSVYIRTPDGRYYKTFTVAHDEQADIAVIKVEDNDFRFGRQELPYTFANGKAGLGARVYSVGFPQNEIVYSEGYISSRNGFRGNPAQYRLDLPANPGQSGAPVLDAQGNVIGIVTAQESGSASSITYAVSTIALHELLRTLPREMNINPPKYNRIQKLSREQQIQRIQDFTCMIQVYK